MYADTHTEAIKYALEETRAAPGSSRPRLQRKEQGISRSAPILEGRSDIAEFLTLAAPKVPRAHRAGAQGQAGPKGKWNPAAGARENS